MRTYGTSFSSGSTRTLCQDASPTPVRYTNPNHNGVALVSSSQDIPTELLDQYVMMAPAATLENTPDVQETLDASQSPETSPGNKRKRRTKITPNGDLPLNRLNREGRYWYLTSMDFNKDDLYSKLITKVTGWTSADTDDWAEAWDFLHAWTKQWQHDMIECFRAHLDELRKTNPYLNDIPANRRLDFWKETYDVSVIAELLCFATKLVDFEKTIQRPATTAQESHIQSAISVYLKTFYCWVMEQTFQCNLQPDSKQQSVKLFELVRTISGVPEFSVIKAEHFCRKPTKPMKAKKPKIGPKDAFAVEERFALIGEITPLLQIDPQLQDTQEDSEVVFATQQ